MGKLSRLDEDKLNDDPKVIKLLIRKREFRCDICPPNRKENRKQFKKHGTRKPKYKNHRL